MRKQKVLWIQLQFSQRSNQYQFLKHRNRNNYNKYLYLNQRHNRSQQQPRLAVVAVVEISKVRKPSLSLKVMQASKHTWWWRRWVALLQVLERRLLPTVNMHKEISTYLLPKKNSPKLVPIRKSPLEEVDKLTHNNLLRNNCQQKLKSSKLCSKNQNSITPWRRWCGWTSKSNWQRRVRFEFGNQVK